jgi:hypothetical protein
MRRYVDVIESDFVRELAAMDRSPSEHRESAQRVVIDTPQSY